MKNVGTLGLDLASVIALERQEMSTFLLGEGYLAENWWTIHRPRRSVIVVAIVVVVAAVVVTVMDMVIFRTIFFELLVFFTFTLLTLHFAY